MRNSRFEMVTGASLLALAILATPQVAFADENDGATSADADIVVTARKREETVQSVPLAVTALSGNSLVEQGLRDTKDLTKVVPSLVYYETAGGQSGPSAVTFALRGQAGASPNLTTSPAVGMYIDGVNVPHPVGTQAGFFDVARVEVLKGPQGTLYGRNTTGGAVNIVTRGADFDGVHGFAELEAGNYRNMRGGFAINLPVVDDMLAVRLAYQYWGRDGYGKSLRTGQRFGGEKDDHVVRLSVLAKPTDRLQVQLKAEYTQFNHANVMTTVRGLASGAGSFAAIVDQGIATGYPLPTAADMNLTPACFAGLAAKNPFGCVTPAYLGGLLAAGSAVFQRQLANPNYFTNESGIPEFDNFKGVVGGLTVDWDVTDNMRLRSITGVRAYKDFRGYNLSGTPSPSIYVGVNSASFPKGNFYNPFGGVVTIPEEPEQFSRQWTQELNLSGNAGPVNWLIGSFYSNDQAHGDQQALAAPGVTILGTIIGSRAFGVPNPTAYFNIFDSHQDYTNAKTWALFTQNDIKLSDKLSVTVGGRYTEERLAQNNARYQYTSNPAQQNLAFTCQSGAVAGQKKATILECGVLSSAKFTGWSYLASINYQATDNALIYARTARGFRGGALQVGVPDQPPVRPETVQDFEFGVKADFLDKLLRTNVAVYHTKYTDKQESVVITLNGNPSSVLQNASKAKIDGVEVEAWLNPAEGLSFHGSYSLMNARYLDYPGAVGPLTGIVIPNGAGLKFRLPRTAYSVGAAYSRDVGNGTMGLNVDWSKSGSTPFNALSNDPAMSDATEQDLLKGRGLLSGRISYKLRDQGFEIAVFGTNLLNEKYQIAGVSGPNLLGIQTGVTQAPRMYGISLRKAFGAE